MKRTWIALLLLPLSVSVRAEVAEPASSPMEKRIEMQGIFSEDVAKVVAAAKDVLEIGKGAGIVSSVEENGDESEMFLRHKADIAKNFAKNAKARARLSDAVINKYGQALYDFQALVLKSGFRDPTFIGPMAKPTSWPGVNALTSASKSGGERNVCSDYLASRPGMTETCAQMARYHHQISAMMTLAGASAQQYAADKAAHSHPVYNQLVANLQGSLADKDLNKSFDGTKVAAAGAAAGAGYGTFARWEVDPATHKYSRDAAGTLTLLVKHGSAVVPVAVYKDAKTGRYDVAAAAGKIRDALLTGDWTPAQLAAAKEAVQSTLNPGDVGAAVGRDPATALVPTVPVITQSAAQAAAARALRKDEEKTAARHAVAGKKIADALAAKIDAAETAKKQQDKVCGANRACQKDAKEYFDKVVATAQQETAASTAAEDQRNRAAEQKLAKKEDSGAAKAEKAVRTRIDAIADRASFHPEELAGYFPDYAKAKSDEERARARAVLDAKGVNAAWLKTAESSIVDQCVGGVMSRGLFGLSVSVDEDAAKECANKTVAGEIVKRVSEPLVVPLGPVASANIEKFQALPSNIADSAAVNGPDKAAALMRTDAPMWIRLATGVDDENGQRIARTVACSSVKNVSLREEALRDRAQKQIGEVAGTFGSLTRGQKWNSGDGIYCAQYTAVAIVPVGGGPSVAPAAAPAGPLIDESDKEEVLKIAKSIKNNDVPSWVGEYARVENGRAVAVGCAYSNDATDSRERGIKAEAKAAEKLSQLTGKTVDLVARAQGRNGVWADDEVWANNNYPKEGGYDGPSVFCVKDSVAMPAPTAK